MNQSSNTIKRLGLTGKVSFSIFVVMKCPYCHSFETKVLDTRSQKDGQSTRRRRECEDCLTRFTTLETIVVHRPMVVKKDGRREVFCPEKLSKGIKAACQKRPIRLSRIEQMVEAVTTWVCEHNGKEVSSHYHRIQSNE